MFSLFSSSQSFSSQQYIDLIQERSVTDADIDDYPKHRFTETEHNRLLSICLEQMTKSYEDAKEECIQCKLQKAEERRQAQLHETVHEHTMIIDGEEVIVQEISGAFLDTGPAIMFRNLNAELVAKMLPDLNAEQYDKIDQWVRTHCQDRTADWHKTSMLKFLWQWSPYLSADSTLYYVNWIKDELNQNNSHESHDHAFDFLAMLRDEKKLNQDHIKILSESFLQWLDPKNAKYDLALRLFTYIELDKNLFLEQKEKMIDLLIQALEAGSFDENIYQLILELPCIEAKHWNSLLSTFQKHFIPSLYDPGLFYTMSSELQLFQKQMQHFDESHQFVIDALSKQMLDMLEQNKSDVPRESLPWNWMVVLFPKANSADQIKTTQLLNDYLNNGKLKGHHHSFLSQIAKAIEKCERSNHATLALCP